MRTHCTQTSKVGGDGTRMFLTVPRNSKSIIIRVSIIILIVLIITVTIIITFEIDFHFNIDLLFHLFQIYSVPVLMFRKKRACDRRGGGCSMALPHSQPQEGFEQRVRAADER